MTSGPLRVLHLIPTLELGGAETVLCQLLEATAGGQAESTVVTMVDTGPLRERVTACGAGLRTLNMASGRPAPAAIRRLAALLAEHRPDVVQSWLYPADLLAALVVPGRGLPLVWGVHHTAMDTSTRPLTRLIRLGCRLVAGRPARIICCANAAAEIHARLGYPRQRLVVIPNGFDTARFQPAPGARQALLAELGLPDESVLIGWVARHHRDKDPTNFALTAAGIAAALPEARFVCCGTGIERSNGELAALLESAGISDRCHLLGRRSDLPDVLPALDLVLSTSRTEALPMAVGEAMACGVPCAVTDVGDSAELVGETGRAVRPSQPEALAAAALALLAGDRAALGAAATERIVTRFGLGPMTAAYLQVWRDAARG